MSARTEQFPIICEIHAQRSSQAAALAEIATVCARDVGQPLIARTLAIGTDCVEPSLTLHLPVEMAEAQHRVWCLACRLACFCPGARVSVLVRGEHTFAPAAPRVSRRRGVA